MQHLFRSKPDGGRVFRSGLYSAAILAAATALTVLVNLVVQALPVQYTTFDLSAGGLYTLGDTSRAVAAGLDRDVVIYYLCETGQEDAIITGTLDQYAAAGSRLRWELKDPALYPTFAAQYGAGTAAAGSLIIDAGTGSAVLDAAGLYVYDYSDYYRTGGYTVRFDGEEQITSALYRLTSGPAARAYYTTNHGERALSAALTDALERQNIEAVGLNLLTTPIPEDCDVLIVHCPASDFAGAEGAADEMGQLRDYLAGGGRLLLTTDAYYATPNLDALMAEWGLARVEGLVVEGDADHSLYGYSYYLLPDYSPDAAELVPGLDTTAPLILQMAQGIAVTPAEGVAAAPLLTTSAAAYSKPAGYNMTTPDREDGDLDGPFDLAVWAENEGTGGQVIWIGCSNMDDEALYLSVPGNCDFLTGCAAALAGRSSGILIESKALEAEQMVIPAGAASALGLCFILILPAGLLAAGAAVVLRRRRR